MRCGRDILREVIYRPIEVQPKLGIDYSRVLIEPYITLIGTQIINTAFRLAQVNPFSSTTKSQAGLVTVPSTHDLGDPLAMADAIAFIAPSAKVFIASAYDVSWPLHGPRPASYFEIPSLKVGSAFQNNRIIELADHLKYRLGLALGNNDHCRFQLITCSRLFPRIRNHFPPVQLKSLRAGVLELFNGILDRSSGVAILEEGIEKSQYSEVVYSVFKQSHQTMPELIGQIVSPS